MKNHEIELIIVFKKPVERAVAEAILNTAGVQYRSGMDSSRGKIYFYKTGPKFILTFQSEQEREDFAATYRNSAEVYEIYKPDWTKRKD